MYGWWECKDDFVHPLDSFSGGATKELGAGFFKLEGSLKK
jgi:hypothetical protein